MVPWPFGLSFASTAVRGPAGSVVRRGLSSRRLLPPVRPTRRDPVLMANLPRWQMCWSQANLGSFLSWFTHYATADEQEEALHLHIVQHRSGPSPLLAARGIFPQEVPIGLTLASGVKCNMREFPCADVGCRRCAEGRGGYQFRWCDPRWTPSAALDLSLSPQELQREIYKPWPRGMIPIPPGSFDLPPPPPPQQTEGSSTAGPQGRPKKQKHRNRGGPRAAASTSSSSTSAADPPAGHMPPFGAPAWHLASVPQPSTAPPAVPLVPRGDRPDEADTVVGPLLMESTVPL